MTFGPGAVIAGRYHADRLVGAGGMGEVWAGELLTNASPDPSRGPSMPGQKVALKRLLPAASQHHEVVARFRREAVLLGRIQSSHVARVYDFVDDPTFGPVLVMEFIEGPSLAHILEDQKLEVEEALDLAVDLALALCDLHDAKIVHRDLKPGNIIMRPEPDGTTHAVIVDFGIGRQLATADAPDEITGITKANIALGTVEYMAPEQILNSREVTPLTDIYAIGAILFRAIAGVHAFGARRGEVLARAKLIEDPPKLETGRDDDVAREVADIVARCLKKRPQQRFPSARDLHTTLKRLQDRVRIAALDLDSTTADGSRARLEGSPLPGQAQGRPAERTDRVPVFQQVAPPTPSPSSRDVRVATPADPRASISGAQQIDPRASDPRASQADLRVSLSGVQAIQPVAPPRPPMPSIPDGRASMPSIPDGRASMPSIQTSGPMSGPPSSGSGAAVAAAAAQAGRAPFASIPDMGPPRSFAEPPIRRGVSVPTVVLAVLAAFAVGGATGVVLAPKLTSDKASAAPETPTASAAKLSMQDPSSMASAVASPPATASANASAVASSSGAPNASAPPSADAPSPSPPHPQDAPMTAAAPVAPPPNNPGASPSPPSTAAAPPAPSPPQQQPAPSPPRNSSPL